MFTPRRALSALALAVVLIEAAPVAAAPSVVAPGEPAPVAAREVLAAELRMRLAIFRGGQAAPAALVEPEGPRVLVGLRGVLSEADAAALARVGFVVDRLPDGRLVPGELQSGHVGWSALEALLAAHPLVARVEPARAVVSLRPLDTIGVEQGTLRAHLRLDGSDGRGVVVAAIDSPIDVLHPLLPRGWRGVFVGGSGWGRAVFGGGWGGAGGSGGVAGGDGWGFFDPVSDPANWQNFDDVLDPGLDWLFADLDGDGQRGAGARAGFGDDDPALGEPLFVAHDADGDGALGSRRGCFGWGRARSGR
ncbi:MAG: hypothetical protein R3F65_30720 [bacterium]